MDQLLAMRAFVMAVKLRNLGQAAEALGVSRTLVSRHIQALEANIGAQLMIRTTRSLALTEAGQTYFLFCEEMLSQLDEMDARMRAENREVRGELPILCPKWLAEPVTRALVAFVQLYPEVRPRLHLESMPQTAYEFLSKGCEVSLNVRPVPDSRIISRKLFELPYVLCASPDYIARTAEPNRPVDLICLAGLVQSTYPQWIFSDGVHTEHILPSAAFAANSYIALRTAALGGLGITAVPLTLVHDDLADGRLVRVMPNWDCEKQSLFALLAPERTAPKRAQALTAFLADWFRSNPL